MVGTLLGSHHTKKSDDHYTSKKQRERTEFSKLTEGVIIFLSPLGNSHTKTLPKISNEGLLTQLEMTKGQSGDPQPGLIAKPHLKFGKLLWEEEPSQYGMFDSTHLVHGCID